MAAPPDEIYTSPNWKRRENPFIGFLSDGQVGKVIRNRDLDPDQKLIMASMGQIPNHMLNFNEKSPDKLLNYIGSRLKAPRG